MIGIDFKAFICTPKDFNYFKQKYPKRNVVYEVHCPEHHAYYWNSKKKMRTLINRNEVWTSLDNDITRIKRLR